MTQQLSERERQVVACTAGLWGDAASVRQTLEVLADGLAGEWLLDEQDIAVVREMCRIALARQDLPRAERTELCQGVLRLLIDWLNGPTEQRRAAYPFLDAVAGDEELPAYLAGSAHAVLVEQARTCVRCLVAQRDELPAWLPPEDVLGPGLSGLLAHIEWLELMRSALGLVQVKTLGAEWRRTLVKLLNLAGTELARELERDALLAAQAEGYVLLTELLSQPWVAPAVRAGIEPLVQGYLQEMEATMLLYDDEREVFRPIYQEIADLSTLEAVPPDLRRQMVEFLNTHQPADHAAAESEHEPGSER